MRRSLIAGNWKMNGSRESISGLLSALKESMANGSDEVNLGVDIVVAPPHVYLDLANRLLESSTIGLASQDVSQFDKGAYTGDISASMLVDLGCAYAIVGHSERRQLFGEDNEAVVGKFDSAQAIGITPILCVGETLEDRENGQTAEVVLTQLRAIIESLGISALTRAVIAYEPVWAIGTGKTASPEQAQEVHALLRGEISEHNSQIALEQRIIYGGSVNAANAEALFAQADIDGGLVGGASLDAAEFINICRVIK